jgi:hypothetical protein
MTTITITLTNQSSTSYYDLSFSLLDNSVAIKWLAEIDQVINRKLPVDDRERFYNFPNSKYTKEYIVNKLNEYAQIVNDFRPNTINKIATIDITQDELNYFHHMFETYHGLYDQQHENDFAKNAPRQVLEALNQINLYVHRCESLISCPRFVCTWYHKPARKLLANNDFDLFTFETKFGDLLLNYCEIGKTLFDHWHDADKYATFDAMLKPQQHYSCDFTVRFEEISKERADKLVDKLLDYATQHKQKINELGWSVPDKKLSLGRIPLGRLIYTPGTEQEIINSVGQHQVYHSISIK